MNLYDLHDKPEELHKHKEADKNVPEHFWEKYVKYSHLQTDEERRKLKEREDAIAKSPKYAFQYAQDVLRGPFPKGEAAIAKDPRASQAYALNVLYGPFPKGEDAIAKNPFNSLNYARDVLKAAFPKGEKTMSKDPVIALHYAVYAKKKPFPEGEASIVKSANATKSYLEKFPERKDAIEKLKSSS